jgi:hypothetical protein
MSVKSGDIIGFVSTDWRDWVAGTINLGSFGIPTKSVHHVGIAGRLHDEPLIYESIGRAGTRTACCRTGHVTAGCQAHTLTELLATVEGQEIWHYPLRRELYFHEEDRLLYYLDSKIGTPYDKVGAVRSGGLLFSLLNKLLHEEDTSHLFCAEYCMDAHVHVGTAQTNHVGKWNPNRLVRHFRRVGVVGKPNRLK